MIFIGITLHENVHHTECISCLKPKVLWCHMHQHRLALLQSPGIHLTFAFELSFDCCSLKKSSVDANYFWAPTYSYTVPHGVMTHNLHWDKAAAPGLRRVQGMWSCRVGSEALCSSFFPIYWQRSLALPSSSLLSKCCVTNACFSSVILLSRGATFPQSFVVVLSTPLYISCMVYNFCEFLIFQK